MSVKNRLQLILEIDSELNRIQDIDSILEKILFEARESVHADAGSIYIVEKGELHFSYAQNKTKQDELGQGKKLIYSSFSVDINDSSIAGYVAANKIPLNIPNMYRIPKNKPYHFNSSYDVISHYKTVSTLTTPLISHQGVLLGVLQLINAKNEKGEVVRFKKNDESFLMHFGEFAAGAIERAQTIRQFLIRMIEMAEMRDPLETGSHVKRFSAYSIEIYEEWARTKKRPREEIEKNKDIFRMASMLHDVGKVGISDLILKKPGSFTEEEIQIMQSHCYIGWRLFSGKNSEFDQASMDIVLRHHENWDGSGYPGHIDMATGLPLEKGKKEPKGLAGERIPLFARIDYLADVYDALSCRRVYKEAWTEERVLKELKNERGAKFDPELVDMFFDIYPQIKQIRYQ